MDRYLRNYTRKRIKNNSLDSFFRRFSITTWLIIINVVVFILTIILKIFLSEEIISSYFALTPVLLFKGYFWVLLTSMFMHAGLSHLFANMVSLFFIGGLVEKLIGRKRMFWFFILSGIFAGIFHSILSVTLGSRCIFQFLEGCIGPKIFFDPLVPGVGASGAIFALLGLLAVLIPSNRVYLIAGPVIAIIIQYVLAGIYPGSELVSLLSLLISIYVFFSIFSIFSFNKKIMRFALPLEMPFWVLPIVAIVPLVVLGLFVSLPIGNIVHFGGLLCGIVYAIYLKKKYKKKTAMIKKYFTPR